MSDPQLRIFISYRRSDNAEFVERIRDWFLHRYGRENVFMDFDAIPPFVRFADYIRERLASSDAVIVIIGPRWLELLREKAASGDDDFVKIEIELALAAGKPVAPICIKDAQMPRRADLPESLRPLCDFNAATLEGGRNFYDQIEHIVAALEAAVASAKPQPPSSPQPAPRNDGLGAAMENFVFPTLKGTRSPKSAEELVATANAKLEAGDLDGALADFDAALRLTPEDPILYNNRGLARRLKGDYKGAIEDYDDSLKHHNPQLYMPMRNRGLVYLVTGAYDAAERNFEQAISLNHPQPYLIYYDLGMLYELWGKDEQSLYAFDRAIELKPDFSEAYNNRGNLKQKYGDLTGALKDWGLAIQHGNPEPHIPHTNRGLLYLELGRKDDARAEFEAALRNKPDFSPAQEGLKRTNAA
jgi:tetratricopeptide (TPR) repeat protein